MVLDEWDHEIGALNKLHHQEAVSVSCGLFKYGTDCIARQTKPSDPMILTLGQWDIESGSFRVTLTALIHTSGVIFRPSGRQLTVTRYYFLFTGQETASAKKKLSYVIFRLVRDGS